MATKKTRDQQQRRFDTIAALSKWREQFVRAVGQPASSSIEKHDNVQKIDHVWIDIRAGAFGVIRIVLSTRSIKSHAAGFDPRMRIAVSAANWTTLPEAGVRPCEPFDYAEVELGLPYTLHEDLPLQRLMMDMANRAVCIEAWGDLYLRTHPGLHQLHSRRASHAVPDDIIGRDGAIRFYFEDQRSELMLLKFDGQP